MESIHLVGPGFNLVEYLAAQQKTRDIVDATFALLSEGMSEVDCREMVEQQFKKQGVQKFWHPTKVRFGSDTLKSFRELPDETLRLQSGDLIFFDVGPIWGQFESDYGRTIQFGQLSDQPSDQTALLVQASRQVFHHCESLWHQRGDCSGEELYRAAEQFAKHLGGFALNRKMGGHRLGDFPHHVHYRGPMAGLDAVIVPNLWVLEIHLIDQSSQQGSFFEDILQNQ